MSIFSAYRRIFIVKTSTSHVAPHENIQDMMKKDLDAAFIIPFDADTLDLKRMVKTIG
jgi:hypothetical protein